RAGAHRPAQGDVMLQPAVLSQHHFWRDHAIRPDDRARPNLSARVHKRARMNLHVAHLSRNVNINSPSETTASLTTQWHFALASRSPRALISSAWTKIVSPGITGFRNFTPSALM